MKQRWRGQAHGLIVLGQLASLYSIFPNCRWTRANPWAEGKISQSVCLSKMGWEGGPRGKEFMYTGSWFPWWESRGQQGNQPWLSIRRTDAETEAPILWPTDVKSQLIGKDPDAGEDWRQKEKGQQRMRWLNSIINSTDINSSKIPGDGEGQGNLACCSSRGHKESDMT